MAFVNHMVRIHYDTLYAIDPVLCLSVRMGFFQATFFSRDSMAEHNGPVPLVMAHHAPHVAPRSCLHTLCRVSQ